MRGMRMPALCIVVHALVVSTEGTVIGRIAIDNHRGEEVEFELLARDIDSLTPAVAEFCQEHDFEEKPCIEAVLPEAFEAIVAWQRHQEGASSKVAHRPEPGMDTADQLPTDMADQIPTDSHDCQHAKIDSPKPCVATSCAALNIS